MDWATIGNLLLAVVKVTLMLIFLSGIIYLIYRNLKLTNFNLWIKYKLFNKNISEDLIKEVYETEETAEQFTKNKVLSEKIPFSKSKEMIYLFKMIKMEGNKNGKERTKKSNRKNKEKE